jgi:hypothetical protein
MFSNGSSFQGRYVFAGSLFLKPLGTSFTMRLHGNSVKLFRPCSRAFQQDLSKRVFIALRKTRVASSVKKTAQ